MRRFPTVVDREATLHILPRFPLGPFAVPKGGDSKKAGRASEGRRVFRKRHEALQEAVREGWNPERDQEARALREAVGQAQEEVAGGQEPLPQEGAEGDDVILDALNPRLPGPRATNRAGPSIEKRTILIER